MSAEDSKSRVVVLGAGIAGLTCAYELQRSGFDVVVLEEKTIPGGRMADWDDRAFHQKYTGATGLFAFNTDMWDLVAEFGLKDELLEYPAMGSGIADNTKETYDLNFNKTIGMLWHGGLSLKSKLRLPTLIPDFLRARAKVHPCFIHTAADFDDESMSEYLTRKVGADFLENIVGPVYRNLWTWNVEQASRAYFLMLYPHVRNRPSYTFKNGMGTLSRALASRLDVRYGVKVESVTLGDDAFGRKVNYVGPDGAGSMAADTVICALRGDQVSGVVKNMADWEKTFFDHVPYAQYAMIHYILKNHPRSEFDIRTFFTRANKTPLSFIKTFKGSLEDGRNPPRIWAVFAPDRFPHYVEPDGSNLDHVARRYVREVYPTLDEEIAEIHEMYKDYVIAMFPTGQARKVRSLLSTQEAGPKNVYYVGDYLCNATTGGSCALGRRTARIVARDWGKT